jgi:hypothetical protein
MGMTVKAAARLALFVLGAVAAFVLPPVLWANGYRGTDLAGLLAGIFFGWVCLVAVVALSASPSRGSRRWAVRGLVLAFGGLFLWLWLAHAHFTGSVWIGAIGFTGVLVSVLADWWAE